MIMTIFSVFYYYRADLSVSYFLRMRETMCSDFASMLHKYCICTMKCNVSISIEFWPKKQLNQVPSLIIGQKKKVPSLIYFFFGQASLIYFSFTEFVILSLDTITSFFFNYFLLLTQVFYLASLISVSTRP